MHAVYCIENLKNNSIYIGSAFNVIRRFNNHKSDLRNCRHPNIHLQRSWNKYGEDSFRFSILEVVKNAEELIIMEQKYLDIFKPNLNILPIAGSRLGSKLSNEAKIKISKNNSRIWLGKKLPPETIEKMRKPKSLETRLKQSQYSKNRSPSHREALAKSFSIPVDQFDLNGIFIQRFQSMSAAARKLSLQSSKISLCCLGKRKSHGGFIWRPIPKELCSSSPTAST